MRGQSYCLKCFSSLCVQEFWLDFHTSCGSDWLNGVKKVRSLNLAWLLVPFTNSNKNIQQGTAKFIYVWYKGDVFLKASRPALWNTGKQERIIYLTYCIESAIIIIIIIIIIIVQLPRMATVTFVALKILHKKDWSLCYWQQLTFPCQRLAVLFLSAICHNSRDYERWFWNRSLV